MCKGKKITIGSVVETALCKPGDRYTHNKQEWMPLKDSSLWQHGYEQAFREVLVMIEELKYVRNVNTNTSYKEFILDPEVMTSHIVNGFNGDTKGPENVHLRET